MNYERNSRKLIRMLRAEGWELVNVVGSHHQFRHPDKTGRVTVPHPRKDILLTTVRSIYAQAGWSG